ncbi:hypothetical protein [Nocardioides gilvus]|uniref:hypothetical protein n=1 Tax=Nocardioides gilvus TaxID=1735589 RepID=UPI0013A57932|nr:hypothetical protein [Nocardioides gilvus]
MTDDDLLSLLSQMLGPTLEAAGFGEAQGGWDGVTFCAAQADFTERFPWLPQAHPEDWQRGSSTDLVIEFDQTTGLLGRVDLEGITLAATVYRVGRGELAARLKSSMGWPLAESLPIVAEALDAAFTHREEPAAEPPE